MKELFCVIDVQYDFIFGALASKEGEKILPALREALAAARDRGAEVVFTQDLHGENYAETHEGKLLPVPHCIQGTRGAEILPGLRFAEDKTFEKGTFASLALAEYAREKGFGQVVLVGVCTDICVISNALLLRAYLPEADILVRADCCAGSSPAAHEAALTAMRSCQIEVI